MSTRRTRAMGASPGGFVALDMDAPTRRKRKAREDTPDSNRSVSNRSVSNKSGSSETSSSESDANSNEAGGVAPRATRTRSGRKASTRKRSVQMRSRKRQRTALESARIRSERSEASDSQVSASESPEPSRNGATSRRRSTNKLTPSSTLPETAVDLPALQNGELARTLHGQPEAASKTLSEHTNHLSHTPHDIASTQAHSGASPQRHSSTPSHMAKSSPMIESVPRTQPGHPHVEGASLTPRANTTIVRSYDDREESHESVRKRLEVQERMRMLGRLSGRAAAINYKKEQEERALSDCSDEEWDRRVGKSLNPRLDPDHNDQRKFIEWLGGDTAAMFVSRAEHVGGREHNQDSPRRTTQSTLPHDSPISSPSFSSNTSTNLQDLLVEDLPDLPSDISHDLRVKVITDPQIIGMFSAGLRLFEDNPHLRIPTPTEFCAMLTGFDRAIPDGPAEDTAVYAEQAELTPERSSTPARPIALAHPTTPAHPITPAHLITPAHPSTTTHSGTPAQSTTPTNPITNTALQKSSHATSRISPPQVRSDITITNTKENTPSNDTSQRTVDSEESQATSDLRKLQAYMLDSQADLDNIQANTQDSGVDSEDSRAKARGSRADRRAFTPTTQEPQAESGEMIEHIVAEADPIPETAGWASVLSPKKLRSILRTPMRFLGQRARTTHAGPATEPREKRRHIRVPNAARGARTSRKQAVNGPDSAAQVIEQHVPDRPVSPQDTMAEDLPKLNYVPNKHGSLDLHLPPYLRGVPYSDLSKNFQEKSEHMRSKPATSDKEGTQRWLMVQKAMAQIERDYGFPVRRPSERLNSDEVNCDPEFEIVKVPGAYPTQHDAQAGEKRKRTVRVKVPKVFIAKLGPSTFGMPLNIDDSSSEEEFDILVDEDDASTPAFKRAIASHQKKAQAKALAAYTKAQDKVRAAEKKKQHKSPRISPPRRVTYAVPSASDSSDSDDEVEDTERPAKRPRIEDEFPCDDDIDISSDEDFEIAELGPVRFTGEYRSRDAELDLAKIRNRVTDPAEADALVQDYKQYHRKKARYEKYHRRMASQEAATLKMPCSQKPFHALAMKQRLGNRWKGVKYTPYPVFPLFRNDKPVEGSHDLHDHSSDEEVTEKVRGPVTNVFHDKRYPDQVDRDYTTDEFVRNGVLKEKGEAEIKKLASKSNAKAQAEGADEEVYQKRLEEAVRAGIRQRQLETHAPKTPSSLRYMKNMSPMMTPPSSKSQRLTAPALLQAHLELKGQERPFVQGFVNQENLLPYGPDLGGIDVDMMSVGRSSSDKTSSSGRMSGITMTGVMMDLDVVAWMNVEETAPVVCDELRVFTGGLREAVVEETGNIFEMERCDVAFDEAVLRVEEPEHMESVEQATAEDTEMEMYFERITDEGDEPEYTPEYKEGFDEGFAATMNNLPVVARNDKAFEQDYTPFTAVNIIFSEPESARQRSYLDEAVSKMSFA